MKKALRYLLIIIAIILVAAGIFAAFVAIRGIPAYDAENIAFKSYQLHPKELKEADNFPLCFAMIAIWILIPTSLPAGGWDEIKQFGEFTQKILRNILKMELANGPMVNWLIC